MLTSVGEELTAIHDYYGVFVEQLATARPRTPTPAWPRIDDVLLQHIQPTGTGGRPPQPLDLDPGLQHFVGIKLTGLRAYCVITDLRAEIIASDELAITSHDPADVVVTLERLVRGLVGTRPTVAAVGVGLGGVVRQFSRVGRAPFLGWRDVDLGDLLRTLLGCPAAIANDLSALVEAEHWFGDGRDVKHFAVITIGASVGGGLVVHDRLVTGADAGVGLLGHFPIDPLGPSCSEGHLGCAHSLMSIDAGAIPGITRIGPPRHVRRGARPRRVRRTDRRPDRRQRRPRPRHAHRGGRQHRPARAHHPHR